LPIYSQQGAIPVIFYPINTFVRSGITDILIISSREHCGHIIENLSDGEDFDANFTYKIQDTAHVPMGIASALKLAKDFTGDDKFAVILGDNFFGETFEKQVERWDKGFQDFKAAVFLKEVTDIERFGCATISEEYDDDWGKVRQIVEKPQSPESNWAVTGLYFYTPEVYDVAETLKVSNRGELEITDINDHYCPDELIASYLKGFWSDMGIPSSMDRTQSFINATDFRVSHGPIK
jgi:glucose-1-phosphate thymidylyltransferase